MRVPQLLVRVVIVVIILFLAFLFVRGSDSQTLPVRKEASEQETLQNTALLKAARGIGTYRQLTWNCQDSLEIVRARASVSIWSLPRSIPYRGWVKQLWIGRYAGCKQSLQDRTIPVTQDWKVAVALVQRIYPGTQRWLLSCSSGEGGHGGFVMNHGGSGAGGWMQFLHGTFYSHVDDAYQDARERGFRIDGRTASWYHPLGQALTAAFLRTHGGSSNWDPRIDYLCA